MGCCAGLREQRVERSPVEQARTDHRCDLVVDAETRYQGIATGEDADTCGGHVACRRLCYLGQVVQNAYYLGFRDEEVLIRCMQVAERLVCIREMIAADARGRRPYHS